MHIASANAAFPKMRDYRFRLSLLDAGFDPTAAKGKDALVPDWNRPHSAAEIAGWAKDYPTLTNTGILTHNAPALDLDILDQAAADACEEAVRRCCNGQGQLPIRYGRAPKRVFLFKTAEPFAKITARFVAPDGSKHGIEVLCDGQQVIVEGVHPDTRKPYFWDGYRPGDLQRDDLVELTQENAVVLVELLSDLLRVDFGFQPVRTNGNGHAHAEPQSGPPVDVDAELTGIHYGAIHDTWIRCAGSLLRHGTPANDAFAQIMAATEKHCQDDPKSKSWGKGLASVFTWYLDNSPDFVGLLPPKQQRAWFARIADGEVPILVWRSDLGLYVRGGRTVAPEPAPEGEPAPDAEAAAEAVEEAFVKPDPGPVIQLADWVKRPVAEPDFLMGSWLTTTSRAQIAAPTGIGKTMFANALGMRISAGKGFLHWTGSGRPRNVLVIDGEMPRRLVKSRLIDEVRRLGECPPGFHFLSHEDVEGWAPLNAAPGQIIIEREMRRILERTGQPVEFLLFDNIMCLIAGSMKDEEPWGQALPWIKDLTKRTIGQLWVHHTGHDESRAYGTKTREWQLDSCLFMERREQEGIDINFELSFPKARERMPATREDFENVTISLVGDAWAYRLEGGGHKPLSKNAKRLLGVLRDRLAKAPTRKVGNYPAITRDEWQAEAVSRGVLTGVNADTTRATFSRYSRELLDANLVACRDNVVWLPSS